MHRRDTKFQNIIKTILFKITNVERTTYVHVVAESAPIQFNTFSCHGLLVWVCAAISIIITTCLMWPWNEPFYASIVTELLLHPLGTPVENYE